VRERSSPSREQHATRDASSNDTNRARMKPLMTCGATEGPLGETLFVDRGALRDERRTTWRGGRPHDRWQCSLRASAETERPERRTSTDSGGTAVGTLGAAHHCSEQQRQAQRRRPAERSLELSKQPRHGGDHG
jgi:hypothetical protein